MRLSSIPKLLSEAEYKNYHSLLFSYQYANILFKCLIIIQSKILMFSNIDAAIGTSIVFDDLGDFNGKLPSDLYASISESIYSSYGHRKIIPMWEDFDEFLSNQNIDRLANHQKNEALKVIAILRTTDKKYDPEGDKPFFKTWARNIVRRVSVENLEKTRRYFGNKIFLLCKENNFSSKWANIPGEKTISLFNLIEVENELSNKITYTSC